MSFGHKVVSALKLGAVLTLLFGSFLALAPAAAAAAPAPAAVAADGPSIAATYNCGVAYNTQVFIFDYCNVTSGSIRLAVICSNGVQYLGPILGVGYWNGDWGVNCAPGRWVEARVYHLS